MGQYSPFGTAVFGETIFGAPPTVSLSSTITIQPFAYDGLFVSWTVPGSTSTWSSLALVRSSSNTPQTINDGVILLQTASSSGVPTNFTDTGLMSGRFYYYAIFLYYTNPNLATPQSSYIRVGAAQGLCLTNFNLAGTFISWLPEWYYEQDEEIASSALPSPTALIQGPEGPLSLPQGPLVRFLNLLGYEMDWVRSEIESLFLNTSGPLVSGALLPVFGNNYGMPYESALGMTRSRVLDINATYLYKHRGTLPGIAAAGSGYSGYGCVVTIGPNLEIQLDDAAFDEFAANYTYLPAGQYAHWRHLTNCAVSNVAANTFPVAVQHTPYNPPNNTNVGLITAVGSGAVTFSTCSNVDASSYGIEIEQGPIVNTYVLSGYFQPSPSAPVVRSWSARIDWYTSNGAFISSSMGSAVQEIVGQWTRSSVVATPPTGAVYFGRTFVSSGSLGAGEVHLFDAEQVEINNQATPGPTAWDPPRDIKVNLLPARRNLIYNPNGFLNAGGWSSSEIIHAPYGNAIFGETLFGAPTGGSPSSTVTSSTAGSWPAGTNSGFIITQVSGSVISSSFAAINATPGTTYTFTGYFEAVTTGRSVLLTISFYDFFGKLLLSVHQLAFNDVTGSFTRGSAVNALAPAMTTTLVPSFSITNVGAGEQHKFGAMMVEPAGYIGPYFDGNTTSATVDYIWEGTPNFSISDNYPNYANVNSRLLTALPTYIPIGATFSLVYGAAAVAAAAEEQTDQEEITGVLLDDPFVLMDDTGTTMDGAQ